MARSKANTTPIATNELAHDVFLSFRGEDTRYTFTAHLYSALSRHKVKTYIDNEIQRGDEISPSLITAINDAKISVVVFSENYANSRWCLDELVKILDCKKNKEQIIVPIFYHVNPTQVRNQTGSYAVSFEAHEKRYVDDLSKIQTWRLALAEAANFSGWDCMGTRSESELVEEIATDIWQKVDTITSGGLERNIATLRQLAQQKHDKSLKTGSLEDMADLIKTIDQLTELKLEKATRSDDITVWEDLIASFEIMLQFKKDKFERSYAIDDGNDFQTSMNHAQYIKKQVEYVKQGFFRGF